MANRIRVWLPEAHIPFLPPPGEFLKIIGLPGGLGSLVRYKEKKSDLPIPDPKTLKCAEKHGVPLKTAERIKALLLHGVPVELEQRLQDDAENVTRSDVELSGNGLAWSFTITGFRHSVLAPDRDETRTETLVRNRIGQELEFLQARREITNGFPASVANKQVTEYAVSFLSTHTKVPREHIRAAFASSGFEWDSPECTSSFEVFFLWTWLKVDFYYRMLCTLSLDLMELFAQNEDINEHKDWFVQEGCFGNMSPKMEGDKLKFPFEALLESWRKIDAQEGVELKWADIAGYLPDPYNLPPEKSLAKGQSVGERKADIRKNKKSRLREWRQGTRPQSEQLEKFVRCLIPEDCDDSFALLKARVAVAWGVFINEERKAFKNQGLEEQFSCLWPAFSDYGAYWSDYRSEAEMIVGANVDKATNPK